ncbi:MAG: helix-turn-helix transcriptional regulator [Bacilli bacterium]|nr:helix-turn-helix transcriptional regulator [Bacilli bacterium]
MLCDKIIELRKSKDISQEQLADIIDTSRQAVSKWERGESLPDIDKLRELAIYFDVSIDYLLDYDIKSTSVKKFIERIDKCLEASKFDISVDEVKLIVTKNPNNFDLLSKAINYLAGYLLFSNDDVVGNLVIEYCERGIVIFKKDNINNVTINQLQKGIISVYLKQEKYDLAKEYIESNNIQNANIEMASCELALGNIEAAQKIASEAFLKSVADIVNTNNMQVEALLKNNKVKDAYDLVLWSITFINSITKKGTLFNNIMFAYMFLKAFCERNLGMDYSDTLNYLKETKDSINNVDVSSTGEVKYYYNDKEPIYASFDLSDMRRKFIDESPKALKEDAVFIYKEVMGEDYE